MYSIPSQDCKDDPTDSCSLANACIGTSDNHRLAVQSDLGVAPRTLCEQDPSRQKDLQTWQKP
jgi:hypothetical protein